MLLDGKSSESKGFPAKPRNVNSTAEFPGTRIQEFTFLLKILSFPFNKSCLYMGKVWSIIFDLLLIGLGAPEATFNLMAGAKKVTKKNKNKNNGATNKNINNNKSKAGVL